MKVTGQHPPKSADITAGKSKEAERKGEDVRRQVKDAATPAGNRTSLTTTRLRDAVKATPDVREDRVAAAKARLLANQGRVDADKLAENMINAALREDLERP